MQMKRPPEATRRRPFTHCRCGFGYEQLYVSAYAPCCEGLAWAGGLGLNAAGRPGLVFGCRRFELDGR